MGDNAGTSAIETKHSPVFDRKDDDDGAGPEGQMCINLFWHSSMAGAQCCLGLVSQIETIVLLLLLLLLCYYCYCAITQQSCCEDVNTLLLQSLRRFHTFSCKAGGAVCREVPFDLQEGLTVATVLPSLNDQLPICKASDLSVLTILPPPPWSCSEELPLNIGVCCAFNCPMKSELKKEVGGCSPMHS